MFSSRWAGSLDSSPAENFAVKDGIFGWRQIGKFNWEVYGEYAPIYNGSLATGLLRTPDSTLNSTFVTRFPVYNLFKKNTSVSRQGWLRHTEPSAASWVCYSCRDTRMPMYVPPF